jgi:hypothetical protein
MVFSAENIPNRSTYIRGPLVASNSSFCASLSKKSRGSFALFITSFALANLASITGFMPVKFKFDKSNTEQPEQYLNDLSFWNEKYILKPGVAQCAAKAG